MSRILLTGASSFTGCWLAEALARRGASIVAPLRGTLTDGDRLRSWRIEKAARHARLVESAPLGSHRLLGIVEREGPFDLVFLHGAEVGNFRSIDYDPLEMTRRNTAGIDALLDALARQGCRRMVVTGSLFEADEGHGDGPRPAIGAYGLAKTLSWQAMRFAGERRGFAVGKVIIPHPFGPLEKPGLVSELMRHWMRGAPAPVRHMSRVRDFIPVQILASAQANFALTLPNLQGMFRLAPSGFAETVGSFATRLGDAVRPLVGSACALECAPCPSAAHADDDEPAERINGDGLVDPGAPEMPAIWASIVEFYTRLQQASMDSILSIKS